MSDKVEIETSLTIQFELEEEIMNTKSEPVAEAVPHPVEVPKQSDEHEDAVQVEQKNTEEENLPTHGEQQQTDERTEKQREDDNASYYYKLIEQTIKKESEDNQKIIDDMKNKQLKVKPMEEMIKIKTEPVEPPVDKPQTMDMEPQDLRKKLVRKGHSFSRRRHIYRRRSTIMEPTTSYAARYKKYIELSSDDEENEDKPETETKDEPGEGESSAKNIKIGYPKPSDFFK